MAELTDQSGKVGRAGIRWDIGVWGLVFDSQGIGGSEEVDQGGVSDCSDPRDDALPLSATFITRLMCSVWMKTYQGLEPRSNSLDPITNGSSDMMT